MNVWQVAAGDGDRDYSEIFLRFGVVLVGPGDPGPYFGNQAVYATKGGGNYRDFMPWFCESMSDGDLVVLKRPSGRRWDMVAVGRVKSGYDHLEVFGDVDGWDLQHCRQVAWREPREQTIVDGLRRGTFCAVSAANVEVRKKALALWESGAERSPEPIPKPPRILEVDELVDRLVEHGLSVNDAETVSSTIWRLRRLAGWYSSRGAGVGEFEIRSFLIIPLLLAVGWPEQSLRIEWNRLDIAAFDGPYSSEKEPIMIIESKRLGSGLRYASRQAQSNAAAYPSCSRLVVSDGIRYKLFRKKNDGWAPCAYVNLLSPKRTYPYDEGVAGAQELFRQLVP